MDICHSAKAIDLAEAFVEAAGIDELETSAYAILTNPTPNTLTYKIAFKFDESVSAFNASLCRVVVVSTDTRAVSFATEKDQQITSDMIPIEAMVSGHDVVTPSSKRSRMRSRTKSNGEKKSSGGGSSSGSSGGGASSSSTSGGKRGSSASRGSSSSPSKKTALGSYLVLARTNPVSSTKDLRSEDVVPAAAAVGEEVRGEDTIGSSSLPLSASSEKWMGRWYDETNEQYVVRGEDGTYGTVPLSRDSASSSDSGRFRVRVPPFPVSKTTGLEPSVMDARISSPTEKFLSIQRKEDMLTIYWMHDTSQHWDIKIRSKRGGNKILSYFFTPNEMDVVLVSTTGLELYSFMESKRQWKRTMNHKKNVGCCWSLPSERLVVVSNTLPPIHAGLPVECTALQLQPKSIGSKSTSTFSSSSASDSLTSYTMIKHPKFSLDSGVLNDGKSVHVVRLYNRVYCVAIDHTNMTLNVVDVAGHGGGDNIAYSSSSSSSSSPPSTGGTSSSSGTGGSTNVASVARSFPLYGEGRMSMSLVDNLLCVHVPAIKVTLVYDIASEGDRPVANPMSLVCVPTPIDMVATKSFHTRVSSAPSSFTATSDPSGSERSTSSDQPTHRKTISSSASLALDAATNSSISTDPSTSSTTATDPSSPDHSDSADDETSLYFDPYDGGACSPLWPHYYVRSSPSTTTNSFGLTDSISLTRDVWSLRINLVEVRNLLLLFLDEIIILLFLLDCDDTFTMDSHVVFLSFFSYFFFFQALRSSFGSSPGIVAGFLMRRSDDGYISEDVRLRRMLSGGGGSPSGAARGTFAKSLLLSELLSSARQSVDLGKLVSAFNVLCRVYRIALSERTRRLGTTTSSSSSGGSSSSSSSSSSSGGSTSVSSSSADPSSSVLAEEHHTTTSASSSTAGRPKLQRRVSMASPMMTYQSVRTQGGMIVVLQRDVFKHVLQPMLTDATIGEGWTYAVMFEYLRSLQRFRIPGTFVCLFVVFLFLSLSLSLSLSLLVGPLLFLFYFCCSEK